MKYVTVIGSRELPHKYAERLIEVIKILNEQGYVIRSGGAKGSDSLVTKFATSKHIFVPWIGFSGSVEEYDVSKFRNYQKAREIAAAHHSQWGYLSNGVRKLHTRNVYQVLGMRLDEPSEFIVCYTPDGATHETTNLTGGTGQAIRIAVTYKVPVYNVQNEFSYVALLAKLNEVKK